MTDFDLIVLGGGTGNIVASAAADNGLETAIVEEDRLGGTCLNRGCNPSKQLIHRADVVETIQEAESFGISASVEDIDFEGIVEDVIGTVIDDAEAKAERAREHEHLTFYQASGQFIDERTIAIETDDGDKRITGDRVVLAGGSRPLVPPIDGTDEVNFLTSADALRLTERPDHLVVIGGGYISVEMSHFFGRMGADVTIVGHGDVLLDREDHEIAERLTEAYDQRHDLHLGYRATAIANDNGETIVTAESDDGDEINVRGDELLLATGRRPNTDTWGVEAGGIELGEDGFVETNEFLETSAANTWAIGDIAGNYMLKHSGDKEAEYAVANAVRGEHRAVEYPGMAHAVFGSPQVASLGKTEKELDDDCEYAIGTAEYEDTALGAALEPDAGFVKTLVGLDGEVVGCHVVGPEASTLIHEVSTAVAAGGDAERIAETIHVHPALSEVVQSSFRDVRDVAPSGI